MPATAVQSIPSTKEWRWLAWWITANGVGWTTGMLIARQIAVLFDYHGYSDVWQAILAIGAIGLAWSTAHWLALRGYLPISARWIGLTTLAFALPTIVLNYNNDFPWWIYWLDLLMGVAVGGAQWLLLRRQVAWAWLWIPAVTIGMFLSRWITNAWYEQFGYSGWGYGSSLDIATLTIYVIDGVVWAAVTGVTLIGLVSLGQKREKHIEETAR